MEAILCPCCCAQEFREENGFMICAYCDTKFLSSSLRSRGKSNAGSSQIVLQDDVQQLLEKCRTDPRNARKYANLILDIDPGNREAYRYL